MLTHIYPLSMYTRQREDVKLLQMAELLRVTRLEIETETALLVSRPPDYIVLGDFNSTEVVRTPPSLPLLALQYTKWRSM